MSNNINHYSLLNVFCWRTVENCNHNFKYNEAEIKGVFIVLVFSSEVIVCLQQADANIQ